MKTRVGRLTNLNRPFLISVVYMYVCIWCVQYFVGELLEHVKNEFHTLQHHNLGAYDI